MQFHHQIIRLQVEELDFNTVMSDRGLPGSIQIHN